MRGLATTSYLSKQGAGIKQAPLAQEWRAQTYIRWRVSVSADRGSRDISEIGGAAEITEASKGAEGA